MKQMSHSSLVFKWVVLALVCLLPRAWASDLFFEPIQFADPSKQKALIDLTAIAQDHDGFMWFGGGQNLLRYDGIELKSYGANPDDPQNFCGTYVQMLFRDSRQDLWVGTEHALCQFDKTADHFIPFAFDNLKINRAPAANSVTQNVMPLGGNARYLVYAMIEDRDGNLYIGDNGRLLKLNKLRDTITEYPLPEAVSSPNRFSSVRSLYEAKDGIIWIGTSDTGLGRFDPKLETFYFYPFDKNDGSGTRGHRINSITQDDDGQLWLGQYLVGIDKFDPKTERFMPLDIIHSSGSNSVWSIQKDKSRDIWLTSDGGGLVRYKQTTKKFVTYHHEEGKPFSIVADKTIGLFIDESSNVWVTHYPEGVSYFHRTTEAIQNYQRSLEGTAGSLNDNGVLSFLELPNRHLLVGTEKGLNEFDPATETFLNLSTGADSLSLPTKPITCMTADGEGNIWIGTWSAGLYRLNREKQRLDHFMATGEAGSLGSNVVWDLQLQPSGDLLIATQGSGLNRFDPKSQKFSVVRSEGTAGLTSKDLYRVMRDRQSRLWIGGTNGLDRLDQKNNSLVHFGRNEPELRNLASLTIRSLLEDSRGRIWIGTLDAGAYVWTDDQTPLAHISLAQGLPNSVITAIQEEKDGNIWMTTMKGLVEINPTNFAVRPINATHGLQVLTVNRGAFAVTRAGMIYVGGVEGMSRFNPHELKQTGHSFPVKLTRLKIFNQDVSTLNGSKKLTDGLNQLAKLELDYLDSMFAFDFAALNYHLSLQNQYAYMLEGFDKDWIYTAEKNYATYTNIPAGDYVFKVKAANSDGEWSENQVRLPLYISPPPWKTLPAYLAYLCIISLVAYFIYRQQQARAHLQQERKLNHALLRINEIKDAFLANTAHELRTPVGGMVGLASQLAEELSLSKEASYKLDLIIASGRRLSSLINDILDYSKMSEAKIELFKSFVDAHSLVEKIFSIVNPMALNKHILLKNEAEAGLTIWADAGRIEQMLLNLVSNAIKYSDSGFVSVGTLRQNDFILISVQDSGIGIAPADIEKLFTPFQQLEASEGRRVGGTGLGLTVTRFLVEQHGGKIKVESEVGKGSRFIISIPVGDQQDSGVKDAGSVKSVAAAVEAPDLRGETIVYADDDPINCMILKKQLMTTSAELYEANNGMAAWELIQSHPEIKFLILDLQMPQLDGFEVAERQRKSGTNTHLPIIFLTANITQQDIEKANQLGVTRILLKPITKQSLWQNMNELFSEAARVKE